MTLPSTIASSATAVARAHVALVCDLAEENWPSMDLVADMLFENLETSHAGEFSAMRLCPPMRRHFSSLPVLGRRPLFYNADRLMNRFVDYPRWLRNSALQFDLFHVIDHSYAQLVHNFPRQRTVVTCHDLDTFRCILDPERDPRPRWFRAMTQKILDGLQKTAHVIAVSAATQDEILRQGLLPAARVSVIRNGVHPACSPLPNPAADAELTRLLPADSKDAAWLLNVGSTMPRKRLDILIQVFAAVRRQVPNARLLRVGGRFTAAQQELASGLGVESAIVQAPPLSRDLLAAAYRHAHLLLHPSEAEGFGLPLIEAMACGCPVIASDLPVLREVGGTAAAYCPVAEIETWSETAVQLLNERRQEPDSWELRRQRSLANSSRFSWAENARQTAAVYRMLLR